MIAQYFHWQFVYAPRWLLELMLNLQRASLQIFSLKLMLTTLIAPWHRDKLSWQGGTPTQFAMTIAWNLISRGIGLIIRTGVIIIWLILEAILIPISILTLLLFLLWPFLSLILFAVSFGFLLS